ncbi:MaoC family dehydratase [Acidaminobacter sp. JC074]|uniref:MaoC family dehydratase n=1 Tax=Acidaminobacter sp. JC074 TaxID=2530199 RepID=UPI001F0D17B4|nr:MaoC family dehydratase [Acidaminobacter sp. JC074]MCH4886028.1 MaoC family dehydratase [Acidaminobacter sp. JC074]
MIGKSMEELKIGDEASFQKTITETDVYMYAGISGDINPAHINETFMKDSMFKGRIVHGMLTAGLISAVLGTRLPGPGTIYLGQDLKFLAPVRFGDTIEAKVIVKEKLDEKNRVILETICTNQEGKKVLTGFAQVMPPKK